jgi:hypothetical protein
MLAAEDVPRQTVTPSVALTKVKRKENTMNTLSQEDHILPRPVGKLPEYAHAKARQTLAEKIVSAFGLSNEAASAISNSVVDPAAVRRSIGEVDDPRVEEISVPGGTLLGESCQTRGIRVSARRAATPLRSNQERAAKTRNFAQSPSPGLGMAPGQKWQSCVWMSKVPTTLRGPLNRPRHMCLRRTTGPLPSRRRA